jgi:hypothetical protein
VALVSSELDHVPPVGELLSVIDELMHTALAPVISATVGIALTVTSFVLVVVQPLSVTA